MKRIFFLIIGAILIIAGCGYDYQNPNSEHNSDSPALVLTFDLSKTTIIPDQDMESATYDVVGEGPGGATFEVYGITGNSYAVNSLATGTWVINVITKNVEGTVIGAGTTIVEIEEGSSVNASVLVTPLEGEGGLSLSIDWTNLSDYDESANVTGTLNYQLGEGNYDSTIDLIFVKAGKTVISNSIINTGYYKLVLYLEQAGKDPIFICKEAVRIVYDVTTSKAFSLTGNEGNVNITIETDMQEPIYIDFYGAQSNLESGTNMTVTAFTIPSLVDTYEWSLNGDVVGNASSITIGSELLEGDYTLGLIVCKDSRMGSASFEFTVSTGDTTCIVYEAEDGEWGEVIIPPPPDTFCIHISDYPGAYNQINNVEGFSGGNATLTIRYTCGIDNTHDNTQKSLYVNGTDVMQISFSNVGWTNFVDIQVPITLNAGSTNTIRIQNDIDDGGDVFIDKYTVCSSQYSSSSSSSSISSSSSSSYYPPFYQAEDGNIGSGAEVRDEGGVICVGGMHNAGAWNEVTVEGGDGGNVTLIISYACGVNGATKSLYVNGMDVMQVSFSNVGWATFTKLYVMICLRAGTTNTIKLQNNPDDNEGVNIDGYDIDYLPVSSSSTPPSSSSSSCIPPFIYEAEDGDYGSGAEVMVEGGIIYIGSMQHPGAWNEVINVYGGTGGDVTLTIRYATDINNSIKSLYINGTDVMTLVFPASGGWITFTDLQVTVNLVAGTTNTIKLQNDPDDNEGVNIDKYIISEQTGSSSSDDLERNLIAYYSLNSAPVGDTVIDESGNGNDLTVQGTPTFVSYEGKGGAFDFSGGGDYLQAVNNPTACFTSITISLRFKTNNPTSNYKIASAAWWSNLDGSGWIVGTHHFEIWADDYSTLRGTGDWYGHGSEFTPGEWNHLVIVYDSSTGTLAEYINGQLYGIDTDAGTQPIGSANSRKFEIGSWSQHSVYDYIGLVDEFRIYERALSESEVLALYNLDNL